MRSWIYSVPIIFILMLSKSLAVGSECLKNYQLSPRIAVSFGLEVEFDLDKNPRVLDDYRSEKTSEKKWSELTYEEKRHLISNKSKVTKLIKMSHVPEWLPLELRREASGTFELTDVVFHSYSDWKKALEESKTRYGIGAAQTHLVYNPAEVVGSLTGFVAFSGDLAQLNLLEKGYSKYLHDLGKIPGNNLMHFVLGPMRGEGLVNTKKFEDKIRSDSKVLNETGGKYYLATVLRGGIYGNKPLAGFELRQFNFDYQGLDREVQNTLQLIDKNLFENFRVYEGFSETHQQIIDRLQHDYPTNSLQWIEKLEFLSAKNKNFYFNLISLFKDWKRHPIISSLSAAEQLKLRTAIIEKESHLISEINQVLKQNLSEKEAQNKVRVLVAKYFYELKLSDLFKNEYQRILSLTKSYPNAS